MIKNRIEVADSMEPYINKYFSHEYIMRNIFHMTEEEIEQEKKKIDEEMKDKTLNPEEEEF